MKKIIYSSFLKLIAVILLITSIVCGVLTMIYGNLEYGEEEQDIYAFESDFSESWYISYLLSRPENLLMDAYYSAYGEREYEGEVTFDDQETYSQETNAVEDPEIIEDNLTQTFGDPYNFEKINYYVQWNDLVFTNCGAVSPEELMQGEYYSYLKRDNTGMVERSSTNELRGYWIEGLERFDSTSVIVISCSVKEETAKEYRAIWERQENIFIGMCVQTLLCAIVALILLIYLLCVCGKKANGEYKNMWLDNVWVEMHLAAVIAAGVGSVALCIFVLEEYMWGNFPHILIGWAIGAASAFGSLVIITSLLSIIRNIKTKRLVETSIILRILRWILHLIIKMIKWIWRLTKAFWTTIFRMLSKKTGVLFTTMLFVYTALIGVLGVCTAISPIWLLIGFLLFGIACFAVACRAKDLDEIKKGVSEVRSGNVSYKIPELKCDDMKPLAVNINDIAKGLDESVSAKVKAERLKSELITNVSHDLKTPITSIVSYTELLSKIDELPEEAKDYVSVIAKKSDRLKRLTQDLFDISKAQSGNDDVVLEKLDVALLINQALGEHDNEIQSSGLPFCVEAPKELFILADGRKMSRVLSNLINNILKYTMKNTRVFIAACEKEGNIEIEFKNISAYPLNFNVEEITQRFVRGDESRTAEGNGLGLAIAKSYTEICNGVFEIVVDGDMFKAILKFKKYS